MCLSACVCMCFVCAEKSRGDKERERAVVVSKMMMKESTTKYY